MSNKKDWFKQKVGLLDFMITLLLHVIFLEKNGCLSNNDGIKKDFDIHLGVHKKDFVIIECVSLVWRKFSSKNGYLLSSCAVWVKFLVA